MISARQSKFPRTLYNLKKWKQDVAGNTCNDWKGNLY